MRISKKAVACYMLKSGISNQKDLAIKSGLSANTISNLMRGASANIKTIGKLAAALDVELDAILLEEN